MHLRFSAGVNLVHIPNHIQSIWKGAIMSTWILSQDICASLSVCRWVSWRLWRRVRLSNPVIHFHSRQDLPCAHWPEVSQILGKLRVWDCRIP